MKAPNGTPLRGTAEIIPASSNTYGTEVYWNGQKTVTVLDVPIWIDENGDEWLETRLIEDDAEPLPPATVRCLHRELALSRIAETLADAALSDHLSPSARSSLAQAQFHVLVDVLL